MDAPQPKALISVPAAHFVANVLELMELSMVMTSQTAQLNGITTKVVTAFQLLPENARRVLIPDEAFRPMSDMVTKGMEIANVIVAYLPVFTELLYCRSVDYYVFYISELAALIFRTKPETLKSNETVTYEALFEHPTLEDLINTIIERKVEELSFKGLFAIAEYFERRLRLELFTDHQALARAIEIVENRNISVHNRGVVNRTYLNRVKSSRYAIGHKLKMEPEKMRDDVIFLVRAVELLDKAAEAKFGIERKEPTPESALGGLAGI